ncbi:Endonuclease/exonuclease/phosphatase [Pelagophyceae sp. CCMP2097]|nr:Endonuclease/exonuclease/phosphatase [Pelagophyceae sp. CCMP2097]|mmetsp:Transcript_12489/g.44319  ORF Transcript_12489/g.44319 Transcript_12489/m.44319 type:complete len:332 (+) Transcript_12489:79-1074(+)
MRLLLASLAVCARALERAPSAVRVLTYNVHAWRDSDHADNFERLVETINAAQPDFVCLNEVLHAFDGADQAADYWQTVQDGKGRGLVVQECSEASSYLHRLARRCGFDHIHFSQATREDCYFGDISFGNVVLSKVASVDSGAIHMMAESDDLHLGDQQRDYVEDRSCCYATFKLVDGVEVTLCAVHLDHKSEPLRKKQLEMVLDGLPDSARSAEANVVVCGDLNTFRAEDHSSEEWQKIVDVYAARGWGVPEDDSLALDYLESMGYLDAFALTGPACVKKPTCWTHEPLFRIDHFMLSSNLADSVTAPVVYNVHDSTASDHFPVSIDLQLF